MLKKLVAAMIVAVAVFTATAAAGPLTVVVNSESLIRGTYIFLGDVAVIAGDDANRIEALKGLRLGSAPPPGGKTALTPELLGSRLASTGADLSDIVWKVPPVITVAAAAQTVSGQMLADTAQAFIRERSGGADIEINLMARLDDILAPVGEITLKPELPYGVRFNAPTTALVRVMVDGQQFIALPVRFNVRLFQNVVVAARTVAAREILSQDSLRYERMDVSRLPAGYATDIASLTGLETRRMLLPGTVVSDSAVTRPVIVRRNMPVKIIARCGGAEAAAAGQALQDGSAGQVIRVQNLSSRRIVSAQVIDETTVRVVAP